MIDIKSERELVIMRQAGKITAHAHEIVRKLIEPGITTGELDNEVEKFIRAAGGIPAFKGYHGFPASICTSVNDEVVHGIPGKRKLIEGDIISVDIGVFYDGYAGDSAKTHPVGKINEEAGRLIKVTRESFYEGIKHARAGCRLSDISNAVQAYVETRNFAIVRDFVGHGIGKELHESPQIPNFGKPGKGPRLEKGMTLAIEPMVNQGIYNVVILRNNWTVVTADAKLSAHYEHTIAVTDDEPEILTSL